MIWFDGHAPSYDRKMLYEPFLTADVHIWLYVTALSLEHNSDRDRNNKQGGEHGSALFFRTSGHPLRSKKLSAKSWESTISSKIM